MLVYQRVLSEVWFRFFPSFSIPVWNEYSHPMRSMYGIFTNMYRRNHSWRWIYEHHRAYGFVPPSWFRIIHLSFSIMLNHMSIIYSSYSINISCFRIFHHVPSLSIILWHVFPSSSFPPQKNHGALLRCSGEKLSPWANLAGVGRWWETRGNP